jgi:hypothetical protein
MTQADEAHPVWSVVSRWISDENDLCRPIELEVRVFFYRIEFPL